MKLDNVNELKAKFSEKEWFDSVGYDNYGNTIVYTKYSCHETINDIPDYINGSHILVHFAVSKPSIKCKFVTEIKARSVIVDEKLSFEEFESQIDLLKLTNELDSLKNIYGTDVLESIFFEVHDGVNAITNISKDYTLVRESVDNLYNKYGFDVIYDQLS